MVGVALGVRDFCVGLFGEEGAYQAYATDESGRARAKRASGRGASIVQRAA